MPPQRLYNLTATECAIIADVLNGHCSVELLAAHRRRSASTIRRQLAGIYDKLMLEPKNMTAMVLKIIAIGETN